MKCKRIQKMLADYVNEILGSEDTKLVQDHIAECDSCRREVDMPLGVFRRGAVPRAGVPRRFLDMHLPPDADVFHRPDP